LITFSQGAAPTLAALNLVLELKKPFLTDNTYWLNINDSSFPFVAVVEHTNFINKKYYGGRHLVYVGGYYPPDHPYLSYHPDQLFTEWLPYLQKINPSFGRQHVTRYTKHAALRTQPIWPLNYSQKLPPIKVADHLYQASMEQVYPYDRGLNYAVDLGNRAADEIIKNHSL
jgi:protoporphyrinogen oxidase